MHASYAELKNTVEAAGFFTTFQPIREPGDRIVCASRAYTTGLRKGGLGGNSFWVANRSGEWFMATWAPIIYRVSNPGRLAELCIRLLSRQPASAYAYFAEPLTAEFGLIEISEEEFVD
jgi:hypothetical protein